METVYYSAALKVKIYKILLVLDRISTSTVATHLNYTSILMWRAAPALQPEDLLLILRTAMRLHRILKWEKKEQIKLIKIFCLFLWYCNQI